MTTDSRSASWLASPRIKVIIISAIVIAIAIFQEFNENFQIPTPNLTDLKVLLLSLPSFLMEQYQVVAAGVALAIILFFVILRWPAKKQAEKKSAKLVPAKEVTEADIKNALKAVDSLLEKLPDKEIEKFAKTKEAALYKRVIKKFGVR